MITSNAGKFRDRNHDITAAGKCFSLDETAQQCLSYPDGRRTPEKIHKFQCTTKPGPGQQRIFHGRYNDPDIAGMIAHGVNTRPSFVAGELVNPRPKSWFAYRIKEKRENSVYASQQRAPLGRSHDQRAGLPEGTNPYDKRFGLPTHKDVQAGELVNPPKLAKQVAEEAAEGEELYKISHSAFHVGESYNRKYDWSRVPATSMFGIETPHDNRGLNVKKTLKWIGETQSEKAAQITSKRVDDFRERTMPQVGQVHDPIKETMKVDDDHTFGIMVQPDEYGAGDLIHMRDAGEYLRGRERQRGVLQAIRQHLKKANYHNFQDLNSAFQYYDKDKSGSIEMSELREVLSQFNLPIQKELIDMLLAYCDVNQDGRIDYVEFSNFLNWKDKMPSGLDIKVDDEGEEIKTLQKQVDASNDTYQTSSSIINAVVGKVPTHAYRAYGVPTVRSDLPAPRIRRVGDSKNYGDESDAYGLLNPSIYSNHGVFEKDFFASRDETDVRRVFDSIGVEMTNETFQELWEKARQMHPDGEVSVEIFRGLLDEQVSEEFDRTYNQESEQNPDINTVIHAMRTTKPNLYKKFDKPAANAIPVS